MVFRSLTPPEHLAAGSRLAEDLGFSDLWFSEDCIFTGAMSGMTQLLASTKSVPVGLGLASSRTRHPALLAMEVAGLARMYPDRVRVTLGLGNAQAGESYVRWASEEVAAGAADAGRAAPPITASVLASVDDDAQRARDAVVDAVQFFARAEGHTSLVSRSSTPDEGLLLGEWDARTRARLIGEFAAAGTPDDVTEKLRSLLGHGADSLALWIFPSEALDAQLRTLAERVLPQLGVA